MNELQEKLELNRRASHGALNKFRWRVMQEEVVGSVLDFGCAAGGYVAALRANGTEARGVDLLDYSDEWAARGVAEHCRVFSGAPQELAGEQYDTVLLFEVLEHVPEPDAFLEALRPLVGRRLLMSVPDCAHNFALERSGLAYSHYVDSSHVNFFTRESLQSCLTGAGFSVRRMLRINPINPLYLFLDALGLPRSVCRQLGRGWHLLPRKHYMTQLAVCETAT